MRAAASISARWENAWGKFPRCLPVFGPRGEAIRSPRIVRGKNIVDMTGFEQTARRVANRRSGCCSRALSGCGSVNEATAH